MWQFLAYSFILLLVIVSKTESRLCKHNCHNLKKSHFEKLIKDLENFEIDSKCKISQKCAQSFIDFYNRAYSLISQKHSYALYDLMTNFDENNQQVLVEIEAISNSFILKAQIKSLKFEIDQNWNEELKRQLDFAKKAYLIEISFKNQDDKLKESKLSKKLEYIYANSKVCKNETDECLSLEPELDEVMRESRDYDKLLWAWKGWRDATGPKMRQIFAQLVDMRNKAARENGYKDLSEKWIEDFEDEHFESNYDSLYEQIRPLYEQLHSYVRRKLKNFYGSKYPQNLNPNLIPAHLLGNMWAQSWDNIFDLVVPYPNVNQLNLTKILKEKNYTIKNIFEQSEQFFKSLGLFKMTKSFWSKSLFEKPSDRTVQCHPAAFDFYNGYDFRIKMCTSVNEDYFYIAHHEMGHIQYYMAYKNQPFMFRAGANSAFHEAIGDTISLSVQTIKHLNKINLIDFESLSKEQEINFLMMVALKKIAFLPFGYLIDKWRWELFRGNINESNYNLKWWEMREKFQGVQAPVFRDELSFDPGSKFHIVANIPYSRYFMSNILQFQLYKSLCKHSENEGPLYNCDFYGSKKAGNKLKKMLELGSSKHWSIALQIFTNSSTISAGPLIEYFKPLHNWLIKENSKYSELEIAWSSGIYSDLLSENEIRDLVDRVSSIENEECYEIESCARKWLTEYNKVLRDLSENMAKLKFKKEANDVKNTDERFKNIDYLINQFFEKTQNIAKKFQLNYINWNKYLKRMLHVASNRAITFNSKKENDDYENLLGSLKSIYSKAKVCKNETDECLSLEPELDEVMRESRDYDKLLWAWKGWRDATGPKMRQTFTQLVDMRNKAARENGYKDLSEKWIEDFEDEHFESNYDSLYEQIRPLYEQLHSYVRRKLKNFYGSKYPQNLNPNLIPAHLLGNMWAQSWDNIFDLVVPYPDHSIFNFTNFLSNKMTPNTMFKLAEKFFVSLGMSEMTKEFWQNSMIVKPKNKNDRCQPSTYDFFTGKDFRIKMCVSMKSEKDFLRIHKEMTEIQYFMSYRNQPTIFRRSANPSFHEAIGNSVVLSVLSPKHLKLLKLVSTDSLTKEQEINYLMWVALKKIPFLSYSYALDKWRWDVFKGQINSSNFNQKWWEIKQTIQKIEPPIERTENEFDAGAKFHVANQMPYARYFVSSILEFQFFKALCKLADSPGPLFNCDFSNSVKSGYFLKRMLELGASKHWSEALKVLTNQDKISSDALFEYFKPLYEWLIQENSQN
ncbi:angiotensin-converting enzyme [Brachionus plicatilis]|uniref:Angiotensin-converting enzyme n=1 Tax=Brachionus plicatilis TaxID=10195 RepID=A0A3M7R6R1_BRAPC|nr:angiotensin-converting enzyme [Brachionus plicatilis]